VLAFGKVIDLVPGEPPASCVLKDHLPPLPCSGPSPASSWGNKSLPPSGIIKDRLFQIQAPRRVATEWSFPTTLLSGTLYFVFSMIISVFS